MHLAACQWLTPIILATQVAEIRRIMVQSQPRQILRETLSQKSLTQKRAGGVAQGVGPEFKCQYQKNIHFKQKFSQPWQFYRTIFRYGVIK
jgi:hypothetical protein